MNNEEISNLLDELVALARQERLKAIWELGEHDDAINHVKGQILRLANQRKPMTDKQAQEHIDRIKEDAKRYNLFTEEELSSVYLDGMFGRGKLTSSGRTIRIAEMAYYRGMMRGVKFVKDAETPITFG